MFPILGYCTWQAHRDTLLQNLLLPCPASSTYLFTPVILNPGVLSHLDPRVRGNRNIPSICSSPSFPTKVDTVWEEVRMLDTCLGHPQNFHHAPGTPPPSPLLKPLLILFQRSLWQPQLLQPPTSPGSTRTLISPGPIPQVILSGSVP